MEDRNTVGSLVLHLATACSLPCRVQVQFALGDGVPGADAAIQLRRRAMSKKVLLDPSTGLEDRNARPEVVAAKLHEMAEHCGGTPSPSGQPSVECCGTASPVC